MSRIEFNVSLNTDNRDALRAAGEFLIKLAEIKTDKAENCAVADASNAKKRKPYGRLSKETTTEETTTEETTTEETTTEETTTEETATVEETATEETATEETATEETATEETATEETATEETKKYTMIEIRGLAAEKAVKSNDNKNVIFSWLTKNGIKNVPSIPEARYPEFVELVKNL